METTRTTTQRKRGRTTRGSPGALGRTLIVHALLLVLLRFVARSLPLDAGCSSRSSSIMDKCRKRGGCRSDVAVVVSEHGQSIWRCWSRVGVGTGVSFVVFVCLSSCLLVAVAWLLYHLGSVVRTLAWTFEVQWDCMLFGIEVRPRGCFVGCHCSCGFVCGTVDHEWGRAD